MQGEFVQIKLTRVELGNQRKLQHSLELTLIKIQQIYSDKFTYIERSRNLMVFMTTINARLASVWTGIPHIQTTVNKIFTYLETVAVSLLSLPLVH